jgi:hypothetical protein
MNHICEMIMSGIYRCDFPELGKMGDDASRKYPEVTTVEYLRQQTMQLHGLQRLRKVTQVNITTLGRRFGRRFVRAFSDLDCIVVCA